MWELVNNQGTVAKKTLKSPALPCLPPHTANGQPAVRGVGTSVYP
jgi:hypothetical protein